MTKKSTKSKQNKRIFLVTPFENALAKEGPDLLILHKSYTNAVGMYITIQQVLVMRIKEIFNKGKLYLNREKENILLNLYQYWVIIKIFQ